MTSAMNNATPITGPLKRNLPKSANHIIPSPTMVVNALADNASPTPFMDFEHPDVAATAVVSAGGGSHSGRSMRHAGAVIGLAVQDLVALAVDLIAPEVIVTVILLLASRRLPDRA